MECKKNVEDSTMVAYLQILETTFNEVMSNNHDLLWKVTYDQNEKKVSFVYKDGTYDRTYADINFASANQTGWYPGWERLHETDLTKEPVEYSEQAFLEHIIQVMKNFYVDMEHDE